MNRQQVLNASRIIGGIGALALMCTFWYPALVVSVAFLMFAAGYFAHVAKAGTL